jgi:hypothetical protein
MCPAKRSITLTGERESACFRTSLCGSLKLYSYTLNFFEILVDTPPSPGSEWCPVSTQNVRHGQKEDCIGGKCTQPRIISFNECVHIHLKHISTCSMFAHVDYYDESRAQKLIRALFTWVVLEAHAKSCWERVMRYASNSSTAHSQRLQGPTPNPKIPETKRESQQRGRGCHGLSMEGLESALADIELGERRTDACVLPYFCTAA